MELKFCVEIHSLEHVVRDWREQKIFEFDHPVKEITLNSNKNQIDCLFTFPEYL